LIGKLYSKVALSVLLLLVVTSVLSIGFTATEATSAPASYCTWDPVAKQNVCVSEPSEFSQSTVSQPTSELPNRPNYPNYWNYPNYPYYPNYRNYPNYPYYPDYPYYPYYYSTPGYPYYYSNPSYGYGVVTETVTATSYSFVTQTSEVTSIPAPVTVTASATVTSTRTTSDTTAETLYATLMAVFLGLFLATLVVLVASRDRGSKRPSSQSSQVTSYARPAQAHIATSYRCSACGTDVDQGSKFCGSCGAALRR
jgi:hypothetical protein